MNLLNDECIAALINLEANSVDSLVTDPPAGISFMGKDWDGDKGGRDQWVAWMSEVMRECLRVMKPGAHGLVWALPRTSHWTATALEDAGFEVRDVVTHLFGTGFPKSMDISKAIDKAAGEYVAGEISPNSRTSGESPSGCYGEGVQTKRLPNPQTDAAKQWSGWGTALKPASEHWILVRKPLSEKTVAANVLKHGTGGINIDGCRIEGAKRSPEFKAPASKGQFGLTDNANLVGWDSSQGRFPANLVLDEEAAAMLDKQSGANNSRFFFVHKDNKCNVNIVKPNSNQLNELGDFARKLVAISEFHDTNLSDILRVFTLEMQSALKPNAEISIETILSTVERFSRELWLISMLNKGHVSPVEAQTLTDITRTILSLLMSDSFAGVVTSNTTSKSTEPGGAVSVNRFLYVAKASKSDKGADNTHPTVKSTALMSYLIKLVTPPGGIVLDPFMGSGSTGVAARKNGFGFLGIERDESYFNIAKERLK